MASTSSGATSGFLEYLGFYIGLNACLLLKIDQIQPQPYMDEIFHIRQSQAYCHGNFSQWDPKITTLPGLYMMTVGFYTPLSWILKLPVETFCSIYSLRFINILFNSGNLYVLWCIVRRIHDRKEGYQSEKALLTAITLSIFPVIYFFNFLYYTDPGSTFCVLLMYLFHLHDNNMTAAMMGAVAILFRQTNVLWVLCVAGQTVGRCLLDFVQRQEQDISAQRMQDAQFLLVVIRHCCSQLRADFRGMLMLMFKILTKVWGYILVGVGFAVFLVWNGGIVVGDKQAHVASLHFPQILYFLAFSAVFSVSHLVSLQKIQYFGKFTWRRPLVVAAFCIFSFIAIKLFTYEHPYLLADNRHYTFYIWSKIFRRHHLIPYLLIPGYLYAAWALNAQLSENSALWKLVFWSTVVLASVPQMLLEFRYFIIPYLVWRCHIPLASYSKLLLEFALYIVVNVATLYLYIEKSFYWEHEPDIQRFMW